MVFRLSGAKVIHSAFNLFGSGSFHFFFGRRIVQDFQQTINKQATRSSVDWVEIGEISTSVFSSNWRNLRRYLRPDSTPLGMNLHGPQAAKPESPFWFQRLTPPNPGINR
jgi:hypothetical protein